MEEQAFNLYINYGPGTPGLVRLVIGDARKAKRVAHAIVKEGVFTFNVEEFQHEDLGTTRGGFRKGIIASAQKVYNVNIAKETDEQRKDRLEDPESYQPLLLDITTDDRVIQVFDV